MTRKEPPSGGAATIPGSTWAGGHTTPSESDSWRLKLFPEPVVSPFREGASRSSTPGGQASRSVPVEGLAASGVAASGLGAGGVCGFCANAGAARTASVLATIRTGRMRILVVERESPVEKTPVSSALFRGQSKRSEAKSGSNSRSPRAQPARFAASGLDWLTFGFWLCGEPVPVRRTTIAAVPTSAPSSARQCLGPPKLQSRWSDRAARCRGRSGCRSSPRRSLAPLGRPGRKHWRTRRRH